MKKFNNKRYVLMYNTIENIIIYKNEDALNVGQMSSFVPDNLTYIEFDTEDEMNQFIVENNLIEIHSECS